MSKKLMLSLLFLVLSLTLSTNSIAIGLGISPGTLYYPNVLKGGYSQQTLVVSSFIPQNISIHFETGGDVKDWVVVGDNLTNITLSQDSPVQLKIKIYPPTDSANGAYTGYLRIVTDKIIDPESGIGSAVLAAFQVNININIVGDQIIACSGGGISLNDVEKGYPLIISSTIQNDGNVRITPQILIEVYDKYQTEIVYSSSSQLENVLPTESNEFLTSFLATLPEDQYWAKIRVPQCNLGNTLTFNILEKGGISDKGELIRVENKPWAVEGEIIPITALFRNDGIRTVSAKFKGEVLYNNQVVKVIDTDMIDAAPGEVVSLQTFFKPDNTGQYFIKGKVYFNNKLTGEKASVLNINTNNEVNNLSFSKFTLYMGIIVFTTIILLMIILIKKKNQKSKKA